MMVEEKKTDNKKEEILQTAKKHFLAEGYAKTSMRLIAAETQVSLGLVAYHFKSKREIAAEILRRIYFRLSGYAKMYVNRHENPMLYSAVLVRLNYQVLSQEKCSSFYKDVLREDILLDVIVESGVETYMRIRDKFYPELSDEEAEKMGWYGNYVSASMERTLVLYGHDKPMLPCSIPEVITRSYLSMWHFSGAEELINHACLESRKVVEEILREHNNMNL